MFFFGRMPGYDALVEELLTECEEANKPSPQAAEGVKSPTARQRGGEVSYPIQIHGTGILTYIWHQVCGKWR